MHRVLLTGLILWGTMGIAGRDVGGAAFDPPGFAPRPPALHALRAGRIIPEPGTILSNATVILSNGVIHSVFTSGSIPAAARIWDLPAMTLYAGFVEPYLVIDSLHASSPSPGDSPRDSRIPTDPTTGPRFFGVPGEELDPGRPGAGPASREVTPEFRVATAYSPSRSLIESLRGLGFGAAQVIPGAGILRGQAAVVSLGDSGPNEAVLVPDSALCIALQTASSIDGNRTPYPGSLMGVVALLRQTFADAEFHAARLAHHQRHPGRGPRPPFEPALDALQSARGGQPVLVEAFQPLMLARAGHLATELGWRHPVFVATGEEWRRPDLIAAAGGPCIVPLDFPALPKFTQDADWDALELDPLRAWDWAPENPAILRQSGVEIALTTHGLADRTAFRRNLQAALDRGLSESDALAALTTRPAALCRSGDRLGRIAPGHLANLVVVEGDYFQPHDPVRAIWIEGVPYTLSAPKPDDAAAKIDDSPAKPPSKGDAQRANQREIARHRVARPPLEGRGALTHSPAILIRNATVWTCSPAGILNTASMLVRDGKIVSIDTEPIERPPDALEIDARGRHVTPGLVDAHSHAMILGNVNEATLPSTAMVRVADVVDSESPNLHRQLAGGLTTAQLLHGSANPIGGQSAVIKLRDGDGPDDLLFDDAPPGIKFALGENVKQSNWGERNVTRFPQSRMGVPTFFANRFAAAQAYRASLRAVALSDLDPPPIRRDLELEALVEILDGRRLIHCHSYRQDEIVAFLRTMESFEIRVGTLQHILEGYKVADEIARHGAGASAFSDWWAFKFEVIDSIPFGGSLMHERGVLVSFNSDSDDLARRLNLEAAKAIKYGQTPPEEALRFVTLNPARQLRIDHRVGSLEPGKDADFVVWSGDPLSTRSLCLQTWIDGRLYFDRDRAHQRAVELERERIALRQKARRASGSPAETTASDAARTRFFRRALRQAAHLGVIECQDCLPLPQNR